MPPCMWMKNKVPYIIPITFAQNDTKINEASWKQCYRANGCVVNVVIPYLVNVPVYSEKPKDQCECFQRK